MRVFERMQCTHGYIMGFVGERHTSFQLLNSFNRVLLSAYQVSTTVPAAGGIIRNTKSPHLMELMFGVVRK